MTPGIPSPLDDLTEVVATVQADLGDLIEALDVDGASYARAYARWMLGQGKRPVPPASLRGAAAALVREHVQDAAVAVRLPRRTGRVQEVRS